MKKLRFHDMLQDDIRKFIIMSSCKDLVDMITGAWEREIKMHLRSRRVPE